MQIDLSNRDEARWYLRMYWIGDGSSSRDKRRKDYVQRWFYGNNDDRPRVEKALTTLGIFPEFRYHWPTTWVVTLPAKDKRLLTDVGLGRGDCGAREGRIPEEFKLLPERLRQVGISGLWDADGGVWGGYRDGRYDRTLRFSSVSGEVAQSLQEELRRFGLKPTLGFNDSGGRGEHTVTVNSGDYLKFKELFHLQDKKQAVLESF